mmetsp:Transcript_58199/g.159727  ORF Transcript_58199/g.159727 Transcript_58199/m.159727 type:complete len:86 (-) Transcript_58199:81-338(-)|eukprot:6316801-Prymnesium_polylepis.1
MHGGGWRPTFTFTSQLQLQQWRANGIGRREASHANTSRRGSGLGVRVDAGSSAHCGTRGAEAPPEPPSCGLWGAAAGGVLWRKND